MPVTASNEKMEVDTDDNIDEAATNKAGPSGLSESSVSKLPSQLSLNNVMASPSVVPSVTVSLHPLVIMNISEHWTRIRAQSGTATQGKPAAAFSPTSC